jgi:hypothetical protein
MFWVHAGTQPDILDFDVFEPFRVETFDVVFVPMCSNDEIEAFLAGGFAIWQQVFLNVTEGLFQQVRVAFFTAVNQDMEAVASIWNADVDAISAANVIRAH